MVGDADGEVAAMAPPQPASAAQKTTATVPKIERNRFIEPRERSGRLAFKNRLRAPIGLGRYDYLNVAYGVTGCRKFKGCVE